MKIFSRNLLRTKAQNKKKSLPSAFRHIFAAPSVRDNLIGRRTTDINIVENSRARKLFSFPELPFLAFFASEIIQTRAQHVYQRKTDSLNTGLTVDNHSR